MILFRYILFLYALLGIFVSGGFFFNKSNKANIFLSGYLFVFSVGQLNFLYTSGSILFEHPQLYGLAYPLWMLYGPFSWLYIRYFQSGEKISLKKIWWHFIPFFIYICFTVYLFTYTGQERISFAQEHFMDVFMPFNYGIALQLFIYGLLILRDGRRQFGRLNAEQQLYIRVFYVLYLFMAIVQSYLTAFAGSYQWFIYYFLIASSIMILVGYVLYYQPELLRKISKKYYTSSLSKQQKEMIASKITDFISKEEHLLNPQIDLEAISKGIQEKRHHVSQTISEELHTTLKELINKNRIEYAKRLLQKPEFDHLKIYAIALDSGFTNKSTFHRAFVKYTQMTPSAFRQKRGVI